MVEKRIEKVIPIIDGNDGLLVYVFGTAALRDSRIQPVLVDENISGEEYNAKLTNVITPNAILLRCGRYQGKVENAEFHIGLGKYKSRPPENIMARIVGYLTRQGLDTEINGIKTCVHTPPVEYSIPEVDFFISSKLLKDEDGRKEAEESFTIRKYVEEIYRLMLAP